MLGLGSSLVGGVVIGGFPCLKLDGTDDYINIAHHADLKPTSAMTVAAWVNLDTVHGATGWLNPDGDDDHAEVIMGSVAVGGYLLRITYAGTANNPTTKIESTIKVTDTGSSSAGYVTPSWGGVTSTTGSTTLHEIKDFSGWVHIACTWRAGVAILYINGSSDLNDGAVDTSNDQTVNTGVSSGNDIVYAYNTHVMIGADAAANTSNVGGEFLIGGLVSEVAIWSAAAGAANILEMYNSGIPGLNLLVNSGDYTNSANLKGYWKLDGDADDSKASHDGNLNNSPSFVEI